MVALSHDKPSPAVQTKTVVTRVGQHLPTLFAVHSGAEKHVMYFANALVILHPPLSLERVSSSPI